MWSKEDELVARVCLSKGYLNQEQVKLVFQRQETLWQRGNKKRLIDLVAESLHWSEEQKSGVYQTVMHLLSKSSSEIATPVPALQKMEGWLAQKKMTPAEYLLLQAMRQQGIDIPPEWIDRYYRGEDSLAGNLGKTRTVIPPDKEEKTKTIGHYKITREIGRGGMGIVYEARDERLGRTVALKTLISTDLSGSLEMERFKREAQLAASLKHPGIVSVYEVGNQGEVHFFTMDFIDGVSLSQYIQTERPPLKEMVALLRDIADALSFAHSRNIVHRDIKPTNILVDRQGKPYLTDFGLARDIKSTDNLTVSGTAIGTPAYMPPEQACGKSDLIGKHSDVYSLGAVMYELLTGHPPFTGDSLNALISAVMTQEPISPGKLVRGVPKDLETICLKCLEKDPIRRYPNAKSLFSDIERYLNGEVIRARPAGIFYKSMKWVGRNKLLSGFLSFAILMLSIFFYLFFLAPGKLTVLVQARAGGKLKETRCEIKIDGTRIEEGRLQNFRISSGYHRLSLSLKDHETVDFLVKIAPREELKLEKELVRSAGTVTITSSIPDMEVSFVHKTTGETFSFFAPTYRYTVYTGEYDVVLQKKNYFPHKTSLVVSRGVEALLPVKLQSMTLWRKEIPDKEYVEIACADLDGDGEPELICTHANGRVRSYGLKKWDAQWEVTFAHFGGCPIYLKDITRDGVPELILTNHQRFMIVDGKTRKEIWNRPNWWSHEFLFYDVDQDGEEELVMFGSYNGFECVKWKENKVLWRTRPFDRFYVGTPYFYDATSLLIAEKDRLHRFDLKSGNARDFFHYGGNGYPSNIVEGRIQGQKVLVWGSHDQGFWCLERESRKVVWHWKHPFPGHPGRILLCDPGQEGRQKILVQLEKLYCLDLETGESDWEFDTHNLGSSLYPILADLDQDGQMEIIVVNGQDTLYVLSHRGKLLSQFHTNATIGNPIVFDMNHDGQMEVIFSSDGLIYCIRPLQDPQTRIVEWEGMHPNSSPVVTDLDGDGKDEVLVTGNPGRLYAFDATTWKLLWERRLEGSISSSPAVADLDRDGRQEIACGTSNQMVVLDWKGNALWSKDYKDGFRTPVFVDANQDGTLDLIVTSYSGMTGCLNGKNGEFLWQHNEARRIFSPPVVGDVDRDGFPEIIVQSAMYFVGPNGVGTGYVFCLDGRNGREKWVAQLPFNGEGAPYPEAASLIADVDGDGEIEVIVKQVAGYLSCLEGKSGKPRWHRCFRGGSIRGKAELSDFDGDGKIDIVIGHSGGILTCIEARSGTEKWRKRTRNELSEGSYPCVAACDFDLDSLPDVLSTSEEHTLFMCRGKDGKWLGHTDAFGFPILPLRLCDINRDKRWDLVFCNSHHQIVRVDDIAGYLKKINRLSFPVAGDMREELALRLCHLNHLFAHGAFERMESELDRMSRGPAGHDYLIKFYKGVCLLSRGDIEGSLRLFEASWKSPASIFDNLFLIALCRMKKGEAGPAASMIEKLLENSVFEFDRCRQKYARFFSPDDRSKMRKLLFSVLKKADFGDKISKAYENAIFMNKQDEARELLPLSLKYALPGQGSYSEREDAYIRHLLETIRQYTNTVYARYRALDVLDEGLEVLPDSHRLLGQRGKMYILSEVSPEKGLDDLQRSLSLWPDQLELLLYRGRFFYGHRGYDLALSDFEKAIALTKDEEPRLCKALILYKTKKTDQCLSMLAEMEGLSPSGAENPLKSLRNVLRLICMKQVRQAVEEFNRLQAKFPEFVQSSWLALEIAKSIG